MKKIETMNSLMRNIFSSPKNFILFPFALVAFVFIAVFYIICPFYMLFDLLTNEVRSILENNQENTHWATLVVRNIAGFGVVVVFNLLRVILLIPLALSYFMTSSLFTISSLAKIRSTPFAFSVKSINNGDE